MTRMTWAVMAGLIATLSLACDESETGPTSTGAVTLYTDTNYGGSTRPIAFNEPDLNDVGGPCNGVGAGGDWDDCASSIRVAPGWEVTVFEHDHYEGTSITLTADVPDLHRLSGPCGGEWDDCISSVQIRQR